MKVVLSLALVCCYQSPQIGCDFVTVNYINFLWRPLAIFRSGIFHCGASRNLNRFNFPDHIPSWLRSSRSFLRLIFLDPLSPSNKEFALSFFFLEFFLAQKSSFDRAPRRGEGRVNGYHGYQVYSFYQFRVQYALVIYTLLPVRIKTSNIDAAQRPGEIQETHAAGPRIRPFDVMVYDVYTGGNLLCIMQHFQARISTYGFHISGILFGATFFS